MSKWIAFVAVAIAALATDAVPVLSQSVLTRGNLQDPASLDPHKISTVYEQNIVLELFEGLTTVDASGRPIPGVADSWSVSADGLTWAFQIRKDLTWSDGVPLTPEDVVYSFRRLMSPATASQYPYLLYAIERGRAVNQGLAPASELGVTAQDNAVHIKLSSPLPVLPELLSNGFAAIVPRHVIEA